MNEPAPPTRVLLVDDHSVLREGVRRLIDAEPDLSVVAEAGDWRSALDAFESAPPDLAVIDLSLGHDDGLDLIKQIARSWPSVRILVLSMHSEDLYGERALRAGAHGYIEKSESSERLLEGIRTVARGGMFVSPELQETLLNRALTGVGGESAIDQLSDRELAVFRLIGEGLGMREIASQLHLSIKTVQTYRDRVRLKLDLENARELARQATLWVSEGKRPGESND